MKVKDKWISSRGYYNYEGKGYRGDTMFRQYLTIFDCVVKVCLTKAACCFQPFLRSKTKIRFSLFDFLYSSQIQVTKLHCIFLIMFNCAILTQFLSCHKVILRGPISRFHHGFFLPQYTITKCNNRFQDPFDSS